MADSTAFILNTMQPHVAEKHCTESNDEINVDVESNRERELDKPRLTPGPSMVDVLRNCLSPSSSKKAEHSIK